MIACVDGLKSFPAAINSVFSNAEMYSASDKELIEISKDAKFEKNISNREIAECLN